MMPKLILCTLGGGERNSHMLELNTDVPQLHAHTPHKQCKLNIVILLFSHLLKLLVLLLVYMNNQ